MRIDEIEGIGPEYGARLAEAGVTTADALLERGADTAGRASLAEATAISGTLILEWVNHVDLMRLDGVGSEYSDLLEAAGVDSPPELAQRNATNLAITLQEVVAARPGIVRRVPTETEVAGWIAQARTLPKVVTHGGGSSGGGAPSMAASTAAPEPAPAAPSHDDHDHAGHDHDHGHDHAGDDRAHAQGAAEPAAPRLAGTAETAGEGLWARIKRLFGG